MVERILLSHLLYGGIFTMLFIVAGVIAYKSNKEKWSFRTGYSNFLICYIAVSVVGGLIAGNMGVVLSKIVSIILSVFVYNLLLIIFINKFRTTCHATHSATLWVLSNVLYVYFFGLMWDEMVVLPLIFIKIPSKIAAIIGVAWIIGFAMYMLRAIIYHHKYRKYIESESRKILLTSDEFVSVVYNRVYDEFKDNLRLEKAVPLRISNNVETPIAIGMFRMEIILPDKEYSERELEWIFRHELTHIRNRDSSLKLFFVFCNAVFWFLPFMKKAAENAADDYELSCDEEVLKNADEEDRKFYAKLLINTPGDSRGFTTCLSAGGESIRYRLSEVLHPKKKSKRIGILLICLSVMLLLSSFHIVGFTCNYGSLEEKVFGGSVEERLKVVDGSFSETELRNIIENSQVTSFGKDVGTGFFEPDYTYCSVEVDGTRYEIGISEKAIEVFTFCSNGTFKCDYYYII